MMNGLPTILGQIFDIIRNEMEVAKIRRTKGKVAADYHRRVFWNTKGRGAIASVIFISLFASIALLVLGVSLLIKDSSRQLEGIALCSGAGLLMLGCLGFWIYRVKKLQKDAQQHRDWVSRTRKRLPGAGNLRPPPKSMKTDAPDSDTGPNDKYANPASMNSYNRRPK